MADKTKKIDSNALMQWHVQDENGSVFGPVDFETLKEWVVDGRVSPLSQVSGDEKKNWVPAVRVAELEMNCVAEIEPGSFYGPIHEEAMSSLVKDGSIPTEAVLYRRGQIAGPAASEIITPAELQQALDQSAALEFEKKGLEEKLHEQAADLGVLQGQIASLCAERDELLVSKREMAENSEQLESVAGELRKEIDQLSSDRNGLSEKLESLQDQLSRSEKSAADAAGKVIVYEKRIAELEKESSTLSSGFQQQLDSLNEENLNLKSKQKLLNDEAAGLRSESDALRKSLHEQQKVMEEREQLHSAELKDKETGFSLRIENITLEHEAAVNVIKQESLADKKLLQTELAALQDELKSLKKQNDLIVQEKEVVSKRIEELDRKCERSSDESSVELEVKNARIEELAADKERLSSEIADLRKTKDRKIDELASELEGLLTELEELRKTNEQLKADFVTFEEQQAGAESARIAERKLIVLKQLFIEAAGLLQDVEDDAADESEENSVGESADRDEEPEFLEFEEVEPHESLIQNGSAAKKKGSSSTTPANSPAEVAKRTPSSGLPKQESAKKSRKWPFGSGKKNLDHRSLAELEAQARIELQRLSSKGGDFSALFDKNK